MGADANMGVAMGLKVMVGSETEMAGVTEKLKVMVGLEAEMGVGTKSEVDTEVGMDLWQMADLSETVSAAVGSEVGTGSAIVTAGGDAKADMRSMVAGTDGRDDAAAVAGVEVCTIVERIPSVCVAVSEFLVLANAQLGIIRTGMETLEQLEVFMGTGTILSVCAVVSEVSVLANAQLGIVGMETEQEVAVACLAGDVPSGMSPEMLMVVEGASANMATLVVLAVGQTEWKTGPCAAFNVEVVGQDTNTTQGVSSNSGVGTRVHLPFSAGVGMGMELVASAGMGMEMNVLGVAGA